MHLCVNIVVNFENGLAIRLLHSCSVTMVYFNILVSSRLFIRGMQHSRESNI